MVEEDLSASQYVPRMSKALRMVLDEIDEDKKSEAEELDESYENRYLDYQKK